MGTCLMSLEGQVKNLLVVVTYLLQQVYSFPSRAILSLPLQLVSLPDDYVFKYACLWGSFLIKSHMRFTIPSITYGFFM